MKGEAGQGAQSKRELLWAAPMVPTALRKPGDSTSISSPALKLSSSEGERVEQRGGGTTNLHLVTKLEQLAFCLECEDSGPWQMTVVVPANVLSLDDTCDTFCFSRAHFKGNGKHVSCRKLTAVLGKCFLSSFRKFCSTDTSKTGLYLNRVTDLLLFIFSFT